MLDPAWFAEMKEVAAALEAVIKAEARLVLAEFATAHAEIKVPAGFAPFRRDFRFRKVYIDDNGAEWLRYATAETREGCPFDWLTLPAAYLTDPDRVAKMQAGMEREVADNRANVSQQAADSEARERATLRRLRAKYPFDEEVDES